LEGSTQGCGRSRQEHIYQFERWKEYWGLGLGKALTQACIECAREAGYKQLELNVVSENEKALSMYRNLGFIEFGRNPKGFNSRICGFQELVYMLIEL
jgi:ribosomal protein S18 acetylase RimI-like enzyme